MTLPLPGSGWLFHRSAPLLHLLRAAALAAPGCFFTLGSLSTPLNTLEGSPCAEGSMTRKPAKRPPFKARTITLSGEQQRETARYRLLRG